MHFRFVFLLGIIMSFLLACNAQVPVNADTLLKKLDSLQAKQIDSGKVDNNTDPATYTKATTLGFKSYFILLGSNIKQQFTSPFHATKKDWLHVAGFAAATALITLADKPVNHLATDVIRGNDGIVTSSKYLTNVSGTSQLITMSVIGAVGFVTNNRKLKTTTLLASQAYFTGAVMETFLKFLSGRQRPNFYDANDNNSNRFHGPFARNYTDIGGKKINSSFPSGHATVAFAAATVFAKEYKDTKWVPYVAYGSATLIGLSRLTENKHWISDIFVGGVIGFLTGRQIVNNYHRYQRIQSEGQKSQKKKDRRITFQLDNVRGSMVPGLVYTF